MEKLKDKILFLKIAGELHNKIKILAIKQGKTIKQLITDIITKEIK